MQNARAYEPWIYQIARGGDAEHRGRNGNHYRYCKPIEEVYRNGETDYDRLMKAKSFKRFWERWYGVPRQELPRLFANKYNPTRYRGLNLHSYNYRGTIEFRYFDGTLNPADVRAWVTLCLRLVHKSLNKTTVLRGIKPMETRRNPLYRLASGLRLTAEERVLFQHHKLVWKGV
ncbi:amidoligase family protein [Dehalococcoidia bacterium]|nr:amidoligase family protein [Dehalococcoidia bacterium]